MSQQTLLIRSRNAIKKQNIVRYFSKTGTAVTQFSKSSPHLVKKKKQSACRRPNHTVKCPVAPRKTPSRTAKAQAVTQGLPVTQSNSKQGLPIAVLHLASHRQSPS